MSCVPSGTVKDKRFTQDDYHLWYKLRYEERMAPKVIAWKFECCHGWVCVITNRMLKSGYDASE